MLCFTLIERLFVVIFVGGSFHNDNQTCLSLSVSLFRFHLNGFFFAIHSRNQQYFHLSDDLFIFIHLLLLLLLYH